MRRRPVVIVVAALASAGCFSYRATPAPVPGPDQVRVRFFPARRLDVAIPGQDTLRLADVTQVEGRVIAVRGDTLHLAVRNARTANGATAPGLGAANASTLVPAGAGQLVEVRRLDAGRTALVAIGAVGVAALAVSIAFVVAIASIGY